MKKTSKKSQKNKPKFQAGTSYMPNTQRRLLPKGMSFSTTAPYDFGKTSYLNKRYGDISDEKTVGDISPQLREKLLASNVDLGYSRNIGRDRFNASTQITPFGSKQERFGPVNVGYQKNLGALGQLDYTGTFDKGTTLKKAFNPENFAYSNRFNNKGIRGSVDYLPKRSFSGELGVGEDLSVKYKRGKDEQGKLTSVGTTFSPGGPFSMEYTQDFRPGKVVNQRLSGKYNTDKISASGYRNVGAEEGKTFGGAFSKNTGDVTYGGSVDYGRTGLKNLSANLKGSDLFDLSYQRNRGEDNNFQNTIGVNFMPNQPFSLNYSRTYGPKQIGNQTLGGSLNLKNTQASLSKNITGDEAGTYTGSISQKIGPVNLTASGTRNNQGTQGYNVGADVNFFGPTRKNPNRGTLNLSGTYGRSRDEAGQFGKPDYNIGLKYGYSFKDGGKVNNDKAMVSGVSGILRKIKDKKNRKEVAGDMVKQFNREGVNYNKEKFLKNSRSFQAGGTRKPIYVSDPRDPRLRRYNDSLGLYLGNDARIAEKDKFRLGRSRIPLNDPELRRTVYPARSSVPYVEYTVPRESYRGYYAGINPMYINRYDDGYGNRQYMDIYKKPVQPVKYANSKIIEKQKLLKDEGLYTGELDGIWGSGSEKAWKEYTERKKATSSTTPSTSSTIRTTSTTPRFNIKGIIADQYVPNSKNPNSRDYRYRVETDKGFDVIQGKKAFDEWKEKNASEYQTYYKKSTNAPIDYNKGRVNEYLEKPTLSYKKGGQHGGLDRWFAEKWVDVKSGKPCGRQEGESRAYPACRPSKRVSSKTPKTSSELSSQEKARFKATKTSSQRIPYNHKRK